MNRYIIIDIETCPVDLEAAKALSEDERLKLINPIDSKIIAIGLRHADKNQVFIGQNEKKILEEFWEEFAVIRKGGFIPIVGFNIKQFDLPCLTTRSFINGVIIPRLNLKNDIVDLKGLISAFRWGHTRGKLKEFAQLIGLETSSFNGSNVAKLWDERKIDELKSYLCKDLEITDGLYKRAEETNILNIRRW